MHQFLIIDKENIFLHAGVTHAKKAASFAFFVDPLLTVDTFLPRGSIRFHQRAKRIPMDIVFQKSADALAVYGDKQAASIQIGNIRINILYKLFFHTITKKSIHKNCNIVNIFCKKSNALSALGWYHKEKNFERVFLC